MKMKATTFKERIYFLSKLSFVLCLFLYSCQEVTDNSNNRIDFSNKVEIVQIKNWQLLDVFIKDSTYKDKLIDKNLFNEIAPDESNLNLTDILQHSKNRHYVQSKDAGINLERFMKRDQCAGAAYLYCTIDSKKDQNLNVLFSGIKRAKLWLNNKLIFRTDWKDYQSKFYEEYIPVHLNKGKNLLLTKVIITDHNATGFNWSFNLFAATNEYARRNYLTDYNFTILKHSVVDHNMEAYLGPFIHDSISYEIYDQKGSEILKSTEGTRDIHRGTFNIDLRKLARNNLYRLRFNFSKDSLTQNFFYGDFETKVRELELAYHSIFGKLRKSEKVNLQTSNDRLIYIKDKENKPSAPFSERSHWDLSRVFFAKELSDFFRKNKDHKNSEIETFKGLISSYTSEIDGSLQYYCSNIPGSLLKANKKIPLIFIMPFTYGPQQYLTTWGISNFDQMLWEAKLAEQNGFGVVWVDMRSHPGINEIAMTAFHEILNDLKGRFSLDEDRFFVLGNSSSTIKAMTLATRFPSTFAGCIFINPSINMEFTRQTYLNIGNLSNSNIFLQNSTKDEVVLMVEVEQLYTLLKNQGAKVGFLKVHDNTHFISSKDIYKHAFSFIKSLKRNPSPREIKISTADLKYASSSGVKIKEKEQNGYASVKISISGDNIAIKAENANLIELDLNKMGFKDSKPKISFDDYNFSRNEYGNNLIEIRRKKNAKDKVLVKNNYVEGPVNHVFASPFKVVCQKRQMEIRNILDSNWRKMYFTKLPVVDDENVEMKLLNTHNLVIIGSDFSNPILKKIVTQLPLKITKDDIIFRGKRMKRRNLFLSFVFPNPINPQKYVYFVSSDKINKEIFKRDITNEAFFDYEIYSIENDIPNLITQGNFSNNWK
jgi:predicted esterase